MSESNRCERCGGPLPQAGPLGRACPRCMMELGAEAATGIPQGPDSTSTDSPRPTAIGRYRILRLIGEGGMGAVYEAEQDLPRRIVALKIIKPGIASPELLRRFEQESHALGRLQHPGIAQIYEAGTADTGFGPQPYFAMEFIRGKSLKDFAEAHHLNTRQKLEVVSKIAEAVQHAHQRGLIHRDLKPANILVDEIGQPKILDFGVARATDSDAQATSETNIGQLVGTLAYMSPEQVLADPLELDTRSDVYALGVILYELLAGRMPYTISKKLHETIQAIREEDPARLSSINRSYRGDIETIVAKALEKDKSRRYVSAAEFAADIQRYLKDEPIVARPPSASYQLQKFARRNKSLVVGVAVVFVVLVGGIVASTLQATRANRERDRAVLAEVKANDNQRAEAQARARETEQRQIVEAARVQADAQTLVAQRALGAAQVNLYFNDIDLADHEWAASNFGNVDRLLNEAPVSRRNWEWNYLTRLNHMEDAVLAGHRDAILALNIDPDGKRLRTFSADRTYKDWNIETGKETATGTFGITVPGVIGNSSSASSSYGPRKIPGMVLSANGRMLYSRMVTSGNGPVSIVHYFRDLLTGKEAFSFPTAVRTFMAYQAVALSPDGMRVVSFSPTNQVGGPLSSILRSWDIGTGLELGALGEYAGTINGLTFSPDGARLAVVQGPSTRIVNATTGERLVTLEKSQGITTLAYSRDGATVAGDVPGGVRAWKTANGQERWFHPSGAVTRMAFDPGGRLLAIALDDRTIRILDSATGREDSRLGGHTGTIRALSFSPDGTRLVSAGDDKLVYVWSMRSLSPSRVFDAGGTGVLSVQVNPDGHTFLISTGFGLKSWDSNTGQSGFEIPTLRSTLGNADVSASGARIALRNSIVTPVVGGQATNFYLQILDAHSGKEIAVLHPPQKEEAEASTFIDEFRISPDGTRAALVVSEPLPAKQSAGRGRISRIYIWDIAKGQLIKSIDLDKTEVESMEYSPNGKLLAVVTGRYGDYDRYQTTGFDIYDSTTGRRLIMSRFDGAELVGRLLLFSPDGNRLAGVTGTDRRAITIWDARTGLNLGSLPEAGNAIERMAFSPDGTRLASASSDGDVQLWDPVSGNALIHLHDSSGPYAVREFTVIGGRPNILLNNVSVDSISFSPDGRKITLTTVAPDPKGARVRIATWDGTPRQK